MPVYEYKCGKCGIKFEKLRSISQKDDEVTCPSCGEVAGKKIFSIFGMGVYAGGNCSPSSSGGGG